MVLLN